MLPLTFNNETIYRDNRIDTDVPGGQDTENDFLSLIVDNRIVNKKVPSRYILDDFQLGQLSLI